MSSFIESIDNLDIDDNIKIYILKKNGKIKRSYEVKVVDKVISKNNKMILVRKPNSPYLESFSFPLIQLKIEKI